MSIEFDPAKRSTILDARGLDMARADEVFAGPTLTVEDDRKNYGEDRFITIGFLDGRMVVLVWNTSQQHHSRHQHEEGHEREQALYTSRF